MLWFARWSAGLGGGVLGRRGPGGGMDRLLCRVGAVAGCHVDCLADQGCAHVVRHSITRDLPGCGTARGRWPDRSGPLPGCGCRRRVGRRCSVCWVGWVSAGRPLSLACPFLSVRLSVRFMLLCPALRGWGGGSLGSGSGSRGRVWLGRARSRRHGSPGRGGTGVRQCVCSPWVGPARPATIRRKTKWAT